MLEQRLGDHEEAHARLAGALARLSASPLPAPSELMIHGSGRPLPRQRRDRRRSSAGFRGGCRGDRRSRRRVPARRSRDGRSRPAVRRSRSAASTSGPSASWTSPPGDSMPGARSGIATRQSTSCAGWAGIRTAVHGPDRRPAMPRYEDDRVPSAQTSLRKLDVTSRVEVGRTASSTLKLLDAVRQSQTADRRRRRE